MTSELESAQALLKALSNDIDAIKKRQADIAKGAWILNFKSGHAVPNPGSWTAHLDRIYSSMINYQWIISAIILTCNVFLRPKKSPDSPVQSPSWTKMCLDANKFNSPNEIMLWIIYCYKQFNHFHDLSSIELSHQLLAVAIWISTSIIPSG